MKYFQKYTCNVIFIILFMAFTGCTTSSNESPEISKWHFFEISPEPINLITEIERIGNDYNFELYVENTSDTLVFLSFSGLNYGQPYDFVIIDQDSTLIWDEYKGTVDIAGTVIGIEPGKKLVHSVEWNKTSNFNRKIEPNKIYKVYGVADFRYYWNSSENISEPSLYVTPPSMIEL